MIPRKFLLLTALATAAVALCLIHLTAGLTFCGLIGAVTASQYIERIGHEIRGTAPVAASTYMYGGTMAFIDSNGRADDDTGSGANAFAGIVLEDVDNSSGSAGDLDVEYWTEGRFKLTGTGFSQSDVKAPVYATDNFTITTTETSTSVYIGTISEFISSTEVWVDIDVHNAARDRVHIPDAVQQTLAAGGGAITVTEYYSEFATDAGGDALTLADGIAVGQLKKIQMTTDGGGDGTLTPSNLQDGTTITFADVGDFCLLRWNGTGWRVLELGNDADGTSAPVLA